MKTLLTKDNQLNMYVWVHQDVFNIERSRTFQLNSNHDLQAVAAKYQTRLFNNLPSSQYRPLLRNSISWGISTHVQ